MNDYPHETDLQLIRDWPVDDPAGWIEFIRDRWWQPEWGWHEEDASSDWDARPMRRYNVSTGGWSGNESLIDAMQANYVLWSSTWFAHRRGGHYVFERALPVGVSSNSSSVKPPEDSAT